MGYVAKQLLAILGILVVWGAVLYHLFAVASYVIQVVSRGYLEDPPFFILYVVSSTLFSCTAVVGAATVAKYLNRRWIDIRKWISHKRPPSANENYNKSVYTTISALAGSQY